MGTFSWVGRMQTWRNCHLGNSATLLTVSQEGCINLDNPFPWGPRIVPGVVRLLVIK